MVEKKIDEQFDLREVKAGKVEENQDNTEKTEITETT